MRTCISLGLTVLCIACQSIDGSKDVPEEVLDPVILLSPLQEPEIDPSLPARPWMSEHELAIWQSKGFQRRFAESYVALGETEPTLTIEDVELMQKVGGYLGDEDTERAIEILETQLGPESSAIYDYTLANIYFQQERSDDAKTAFHSALAKFPRFQRAWNNLGLVAALTEDYDTAQQALTRVIEIGGGNTDTYGLLAFSYLRDQNYLAAESAYRQANLLDPENPDWQIGLAECLFNQGRFNATASLCGNLIEDSPEQANLWSLQARAFLAMKQPLNAAENFEFLDKLGAADSSTLNLLGDIYTSEKVYDEAASAYSRAILANSEGDPKRSIQAARGLATRGASQATRDLVEVIEANMDLSSDLEARKGLLKLQARVAQSDLDPHAVATALEEILTLDPLDGEAILQLGQHFEREGENERAALLYERAADLEDYAAKGKRRLAQLFVSQARYREALPLLKAVLELEPGKALEDYYAEVQRRAGQS